MPKNWTRHEVELAVSDYISMLVLELEGQKYNKSATRRALMEKLDNRSKGSVESKRMNISAALLEIGIPCIDGYKPLRNYQAIVPEVIDSYLSNNIDLKVVLDKGLTKPIVAPTVEDILKSFEEPPDITISKSVEVEETFARKSPLGLDYLQIDASNALLGEEGESFVMRYEKARLIFKGKSSLAENIEHIAQTVGPSAGYDVRSYNVDGSDRFIEVKTTKYGSRTPFYITPNEVNFSAENSKRYRLYRLHSFRKAPKLFTLPGAVSESCYLQASTYKATIR